MAALPLPPRTAAKVEPPAAGGTSLKHDTLWLMMSQGVNLVLWAAYFILLARLLGVREYGIFAGAFAFVSLATPYSGLGSGLLFMRYVSSAPGNFSAYWGNILIATLVSGALLVSLLCLISPHLLNPASAAITVFIALGECVFRQLVMCTGQVFQVFNRIRMTALAGFITIALRFVAVLVMAVVLHRITARQWAMCSMLVSMVAAAVGAIAIMAVFGRPRFFPRLFVSHLGEGFNYSIAGSTQSVYNDIDKTMLSHYGMNVANGIYTMAYRIVDVATIPISALDSAVLPRFFRHGTESPVGVTQVSERLAWRALLVGIAIAAATFFAAPLVPHILGRGFTASVAALRWLCLIPAFRGMHQLTGSAITGMGFQRYRTIAQLCAAGFNFGANLWLIPRFGWEGAAWASLATDGGLGITNLLIVRCLPAIVLRRKESNEAPA